MAEVGSLTVNLVAQTAQFSEPLNKATQYLQDMKDKAGDVGEGMKTSMGDAKGGLMLVEESIGVRIPRHLNSLIATIPGVGQAFAMMLPIAGVAVAIEIVGKLIEKHDALAAAIRKASEEAENQAISGGDQVKSLQLVNLKLDDQIAKLEHKPAHNYLREAMLETSDAIDKLAAGYAPNFEKMDEYLTEHTGKWARLGRVIVDAFNGQGQADGYGAATQAMWNVQAAMEKVTEARRKMADASMDQKSQTAATANLSAALHDQLGAMDKATSTAGLSTESLVKLKSAALSTDDEMKALYLTLDNGAKKATVAGLERNTSKGSGANEALKAEADLQGIIAEMTGKHEQAVRSLAQTKAQAAIAAKNGGEIEAINSARDAEIEAVQATLAAKDAAYAKGLAAGQDAAKRKELEAKHVADAYEAADSIVLINQNADDKIAAADRAAAAQRLKLDEANIKQRTALLEKSAEQQIKFAQEDFKMQTDLATFRRKIDGITSLYSWRMWRVIGKSVRTPAGQRSTCEAA